MSYVIQKQADKYDAIKEGIIYVVSTSQLEEVEHTSDINKALKFESYERAKSYFNHFAYTDSHQIKEI